jgi:FAD synthetase
MHTPKTVMVFGTFDALHLGHRHFLRSAKSLGDRLIVSLARDEFVRSFKGKTPLHDEQQRLARLDESGLVDKVYLSDPEPGSYHLLLKVKPDLICLGFDQDSLEENLLSWLKCRQLQIPLMKLEFYSAVIVS